MLSVASAIKTFVDPVKVFRPCKQRFVACKTVYTQGRNACSSVDIARQQQMYYRCGSVLHVVQNTPR